MFIKLLSSQNQDLVEQAIWGLGNIIGDKIEYRDLVLDHGMLKPLLSFVTDDMPISFQRTIVWVLVNVVRCRDVPLSHDLVEEIVPKLCKLATQRDIATKIDALWALTFIADIGDDAIQLIIENDIVADVIWMLTSHNQKLQITAMRFLGNIATGTDDQTQVLLDNGILNNLRSALTHHNRNLRRVALWCLSNITIGTLSQAQEVFHSGLIAVIIDNLHHVDAKILKEAVLTVRNLINAGSIEQMLDIIECRCINSLFTLIMNEDSEISTAARVSLNCLFAKCGQLVEKYSQMHLIQLMSSVDESF